MPNLQRKLAILADAAKYDTSCASSGSIKRDSRAGAGVGSTSGGMGICHSYAPKEVPATAVAINSYSWLKIVQSALIRPKIGTQCKAIGKVQLNRYTAQSALRKRS